MSGLITAVDVYLVSVDRGTPYLGGDVDQWMVKGTDYFIRPSNDVIYSVHDKSVIVRLATDDGVVGWGEAFGMVAPQAVGSIITDVLAPMTLGKSVHTPATIYDELYRAMRTRTPFGGFYLDAIAAVDIALWDARSKVVGIPIPDLLGGQRRSHIPVYVSGLPEPTRDERLETALGWQQRGFNSFKFPGAMTDSDLIAEFGALREALGPEAQIIVDFHWSRMPSEAIRIISKLEDDNLMFAEAPVEPDDMVGLAEVARAVRTPIAAGEEYRTDFEFNLRFRHGALAIAQPEMGRTGITVFDRIGHVAAVWHAQMAPHGASGLGIFLAASLQACAALPNLLIHEYQHTIVDKNLQYLEGTLDIDSGTIRVPEGPGLGVSPTESVLEGSIHL